MKNRLPSAESESVTLLNLLGQIFASYASEYVKLYVSDIAVERAPSDAANFEHAKLNHVETNEKQALPSQQGVWYLLHFL